MPRPALLLIAALAVALALPAAQASRIGIVSEEDSARSWERANRVPVPAWPELDGGYGSACINLAFLIDREGATGNPVLLRAWAPGAPEGVAANHRLEAFTQSAARTLAQWRYRPTEANRKGRPLITNVVFLFARDAQTDLVALRQQCLVGDLQDFLFRATEAGYRRGNLNKGLIDRRRAEFPPTIPEGCDRHAGWCE